jgi:hypothetical protein
MLNTKTVCSFLLLIFLFLTSCSENQDSNKVADESKLEVKAIIADRNDMVADRINLVFVGQGYLSIDEFLATVKRDISIDGKEVLNPQQSIDKLLFGLFSIEPFKSNLSKFNLWYFPTQLAANETTQDFINQQRDSKSQSSRDFGLPFVSYIFFVNPLSTAPQSFAYPSNLAPGATIKKEGLVFGTAVVTRYPNLGEGISVLAHELGHSLFNLRDEYTRSGLGVVDKYGFNIARNQTEAQNLWGSTIGEIDPFYYTWKEKMIAYGLWIDKSDPLFRGHDPKKNIDIYAWHPSEDEIKVGFIEGGGITSSGISRRPTVTSLMNNEDVMDKSWPMFPPVFGSANRKVMEVTLNLFSGSR